MTKYEALFAAFGQRPDQLRAIAHKILSAPCLGYARRLCDAHTRWIAVAVECWGMDPAWREYPAQALALHPANLDRDPGAA